ncbi:MAG: inositol-3-phosphate synthase [Dysgonamonadaceae bacterium]|jgi:myo-inositol-1-phosphate synthase|nr:inositol-3-phosphate synthase [Dysgonamonadaceae bacterium]
MENRQVKDAQGKLGVLVVGLGGAVATTFIAGTLMIRKGLGIPVGSISQLATIRLGKREENRFPKIKDIIPLADLNDLVFGGWDIFEEDAYAAARHAEVLTADDLDKVKDELQAIRPMKAVFDQQYVKRLYGVWTKEAPTKWELKEAVRQDIRNFKSVHRLDRIVCIWCGSTEIFIQAGKIHQTLPDLRQALKENHPDIAPSMIYAYACLEEEVPYINGAPNLATDIPALGELAAQTQTPVCGKDLKTGQTLLKTVIAPMLKTRMLGLNGWFSTNILGNRDGEVLDDPDSFKTKEESKLSVIENILQPELYPQLYENYYHKVRINYYPPRKDNKEGWDNIDIFGWLGYPMQLKIDFLCRDSILASPLCLDLVLFIDLAKRAGMSGIQSWLSFYFKSPIHDDGHIAEHDLFIQYVKLKNTLRLIIGEKTIDFID